MSNETKSLQDTRRALDSTGMRFTSQRALILEIIRRGRGHLDADEVYRRARQRHPRLSLSTVYRTLRLFKELGLVEELHFDDAHHRYEVKPSVEHHHLVCLSCGKIVEFECLLSQKMKEEIAHEKGFEIISAEVRMTGYCSKCRQGRE